MSNRNNKPYSVKESKVIWNAYHNGEHPKVIAIKMERTEKGIYNQLTVLKKTLKPRPRMPAKVEETNAPTTARSWDDAKAIVKIIEDKKKLKRKTKRRAIERKPKEIKEDKISIALTYVCAVAIGILAGLFISTM